MYKTVVLICLFFSYSGFAQQKNTASLSGKITDSKTHEPIQGVSVYLVESRTGTTTDSNGIYHLKKIPKGHVLIEISHLGYRSIVEHLDIDGSIEKDFTLNSSVIENEGVTVTAVGAATSIRKAPVHIERVNREQLLSTPSTNIIDALRQQPGVSQLTTGPAISKPVIRGLGYNRLIVINDGLKQEGQQWGDEHGIEIDENSVNRVEIVKGPASLIYGSDGLAGVINILTATAIPANTIQANLVSSYATNNRQRSLFGNIGGNQQGISWNAWATSKAASDYKNNYDGYVWNSKFNEQNGGGFVGYNGKKGFSHLIFSRFNQYAGLIEGERDSTGRFLFEMPGGTFTTPGYAEFMSATPVVPYQHIVHTRLISDNNFRTGSGKLAATLGWQRNQRQEFGNPASPGEKSLYFDLNTFNLAAAFHLKEKNSWHTSIGVNAMRQNNRNKGVEALIPEYTLFDAGIYLYSQRTFGKTTFSGGIRYDNRSLSATELRQGNEQKFTAFTKSYSNVSGSVGLSYAASQNIVLKANLAKGFRAPGIPELSSNGSHEGTNRYEYGNLRLRSESSWQADIGLEVNSEHLLLNANAFYNHIGHFIYYSKLAGTNTPDSLVDMGGELIPAFTFRQQTATLAGFEFLIDFHPHPFDWLHWQNTFSYVQGRFSSPVDETFNVPAIPASHWISELRAELFQKGKSLRNLQIHIEADYTFDQNKPFSAYNTETATPGYLLLNAGITAAVMNRGKTLFQVYLLGSNLTDKAYQSHLSRLKYTDVNELTGRQGVFNMGRNFSVRLKIPVSFTTRSVN